MNSKFLNQKSSHSETLNESSPQGRASKNGELKSPKVFIVRTNKIQNESSKKLFESLQKINNCFIPTTDDEVELFEKQFEFDKLPSSSKLNDTYTNIISK